VVQSVDNAREQRRSRRILASVPVEIQSSGEPQAALTAVINLHGALILSSVNLPSGSEIGIKNPETGLEVRGRVVWSGSSDQTGPFKLGIEFQRSSPDFWGERYDPDGEGAA
jgi:PilZ domain